MAPIMIMIIDHDKSDRFFLKASMHFLKVYAFALLNFLSASISAQPADEMNRYNLNKPDTILVLPDTLREISGVTSLDTSLVACVQDENGIIFIYDINRNLIREQYTFHIDGDYEGIAVVQNTIYILRSDGVLFEIINYQSPGFKIIAHQTGIPTTNNEGLCYDPDNNRLLIASKSKLGKGQELKDKRVIYGFDLLTNKLSRQPAYNFNMAYVRLFAAERKINPTSSKVIRKDKAAISRIKFFTSAIAIHPINKHLYLLSAADHLLFIFDTTGKLKNIRELDSEIFNKAEGITFLTNGDMLISNEAQNKKPTLLKFNYKNAE